MAHWVQSTALLPPLGCGCQDTVACSLFEAVWSARRAGPHRLCAACQALSSDEAFVRTSKGVYALSCLAGISQRPTARNPRSQKKVLTTPA